MKTKTATPKSSRKRSDLDNTTRAAQQRRLLQRLHLGPVDTLTARIELNILHPGGRVLELRAQGHEIHTQRITLTDERGRTHRGIALYSLAQLANSEVAA